MGLLDNAAAAVRQRTDNKATTAPKTLINQIEVADEILIMPWQIIHPDPEQPRTQRDEEDFQKVRMTIKATGGNTQAICIKPHPTIKGEYMIVYGEGRWLSCKEFDLKVKAFLYKPERNKSEAAIKFDTFFLQIAENVGRNDLSSIDEARSLQNLIGLSGQLAAVDPKQKKLTQKDLAEQFGYSKTKVSRLLSLLQAPKIITDLSQSNVTQNLNVLTTLTQLSELIPVDELSETINEFKAGSLNEKHLQAKLKEAKIKPPKLTKPLVSANESPNNDSTETNNDCSENDAVVLDAPNNDNDNRNTASLKKPKLIPCENFEIIDAQLVIYGENQVEPIVLNKEQVAALKKLLSKK